MYIFVMTRIITVHESDEAIFSEDPPTTSLADTGSFSHGHLIRAYHTSFLYIEGPFLFIK